VLLSARTKKRKRKRERERNEKRGNTGCTLLLIYSMGFYGSIIVHSFVELFSRKMTRVLFRSMDYYQVRCKSRVLDSHVTYDTSARRLEFPMHVYRRLLIKNGDIRKRATTVVSARLRAVRADFRSGQSLGAELTATSLFRSSNRPTTLLLYSRVHPLRKFFGAADRHTSLYPSSSSPPASSTSASIAIDTDQRVFYSQCHRGTLLRVPASS